MLSRVSFPLTKAQVFDFILDRDYISYMNLQEVIGELIDADMIAAESIRNRTHLSLTREGKETLKYFEKRLSDSIKSEIDGFFSEHEMQMRNEVSILSSFDKASSGEYEARLVAKDKEIVLVDITISVPDEGTAESICEKWQKKNQEIYQYLIQQLF